MRRAGSLLAIALGAPPGLAACGPAELPPEGQIRLRIDTDASVPPAPGEAEDDEPALFDRLRIELVPQGAGDACEGCTREFGLDRRMLREGRASIGVVTPPGESGHRARVRIYRGAGSVFGGARPESTLEVVAALPASPAEGLVDVHVVLRTDDLGAPRGTLDAPIDALSGPAPGDLAGTWYRALPRACAGSPGPGEVCVPGGAFWMGDPDGEARFERLVVVTPYYLDATEVTVAELRASGLTDAASVVPAAGTNDCTFTAAPLGTEGSAVNCVSRSASAAYCKQKGAELVSEAQWEYVARGRRSSRYVWGSEPPKCEDAVVARRKTAPPGLQALTACNALGTKVEPPGTGLRDALELEGGVITDLLGNLSEWVRDDWEGTDGACWSAPILRDPVCAVAESSAQKSIRGASFGLSMNELDGAMRAHVVLPAAASVSELIGIRCARPAQ